MTSPRVMELLDKLMDSLVGQNSGEAFLKCLEDEGCTKEEFEEVAQIRDEEGDLLLHTACSQLDFSTIEREATSIDVLHRLIGVNNKVLYVRNWSRGYLPIHLAVLNDKIKAVEVLLNADKTKSSLMIQDESDNTVAYCI